MKARSTLALAFTAGLCTTAPVGAPAQDVDISNANRNFPQGSFRIGPSSETESARLQRVIDEPNFEPLRNLPSDNPYREISGAIGFAMIFTREKNLSVCTGFLLSQRLFMTNHHCIYDEQDRLNVRKQSRINFDYYSEEKIKKIYQTAEHKFKGVLAKDKALDYAVVAIAPPASPDRPTLKPDLSKSTIRDLDRVAIVQHPQARPKAVVREDTSIRARRPRRVRYRADTQPGSSGSPVLSPKNLDVVALHYRGVTNSNGKFVSNEGSWMRAIFRDISEGASSNKESLSGLLSRHDLGGGASGSQSGTVGDGGGDDGMQAITE